jgi:polyhydroxyalkanoate synthesis regulator protein
MQGLMGSYLEKNIQTFTDIQSRLGDSAKGFSPELWAQFLNGQAPMVQGLMGSYLEQSKDLFVKMQQQMAEQAKSLFPGLPGFMPPKR